MTLLQSDRRGLCQWTRPAALAWLLAQASPLHASVYNIQLYSDNNPNYTDRETFIESAIPIWSDPQQQAIAIWRWGVRNRRQTQTTTESGRGIWDPIMVYNNYPNTYCGYIAGFQQSLFEAMGAGWKTRYVELADHTVGEVSWDDGATWHMFDSSMDVYCLDHDGSVASCQDIAAAHTCALAQALGATVPEPGHYYLYHYAPECGSNPVNPAHAGDLNYPWGYRTAVDNPVGFYRTLRNGADSYTSGFEIQDQYTHIRHGWRYRLNLRPCEVYTRHWAHLGETEDYYRPNTDGTDPDDDVLPQDMRGNGLWDFQPDLSGPAYRATIYDEAGIVHRSEDGGLGPCLRPEAPGTAAELIFKVYGANVITSADMHLQAVRQTLADEIEISISRDAGINWQSIWTADQTGVFAADVHLPAALIGGTWEYLVKLSLSAADENQSCGLDGVRLETVTQTNRLALPQLVRGQNRICLRLGDQVESHMLWPLLHHREGVDGYTQSADSYANVLASDSADQFARAVLWPESIDAPAHVTWKFDTPTDIVGLYFGGSFIAKRNTHFDYVVLRHAFAPSDYYTDSFYKWNGLSTFDGRQYVAIDDVPADSRTVWLQYEFNSTSGEHYDAAGVQDALMYVEYAPRDTDRQPVEVTYCWTEHRRQGDVMREHTFLASAEENYWSINVGGYRDPTMNWVRVNLAGHGPDGDPIYGYHDGEDVGPQAGYDKKVFRYDLLDNLARGKPYAVSRPAAALNPDTEGTELTNGCIIPSAYEAASGLVQIQTALWESDASVEVSIDLQAVFTIAALRVTTHQPNDYYSHADSILVSVSSDGESYSSIGTIRHDDVWSPPGDFLRWERGGSPLFSELPAMGHLAHSFYLIPDEPVSGRYVKCDFLPLAGRGLGISEIQAFQNIQVQDWPDKEIWMPTAISVGPYLADGQIAEGSAVPLALLHGCAPNPFNARTSIRYNLPEPQSVDLYIYDVAGRLVRELQTQVFQRAGSHELVWNGNDERGKPVASGVYLYRLNAGGGAAVGRMLLVK